MIRNILLLCLFVLCLCIRVTNAQNVQVKDADSNKPIELVTILSGEPKAFEITNADGLADITAFKAANKIEIRSLGYRTVILSYADLIRLDFEVFLKPTHFTFDEVIVSANRWRQNSNSVPSKIVSITKQDIALENPQTAADLLAVNGNVYIQKSQQGGGSPMIRGFATNRLMYTVDGVRMNTAIFRGGNIQNVINLDPFAIEKAEVLFGPGSVIYGSDAIGGVMSFQTLKPQFSLSENPLIKGKASTRLSSANNEKTFHFDVNVGWQKWALVTSFSSWDFGDLRQGSNGPDDYLKSYYVQRVDGRDVVVSQDDKLIQNPSAYSQVNMMQKVRFKPSKNLDIAYGFHYSETSNYGRYDRHNRVRNGTARYAEWSYGPQKWMMNVLSINHLKDSGLYNEMSIRIAEQNFEESRISRSLNKDDREIREEDVDAFSVNIDFLKDISSKSHLFYGIEYVYDDVTSTGIDEDISTGVRVDGPARYPNSTWKSIGVYLNHKYDASNKLTIQSGLRYNQYLLDADFDTKFYNFPFDKAEIDNGSVTASIGAIYRPDPSWVFSANIGTAFRSPNVDDVGKVFDSEPGAVTVPNPDLEAEYAYNLDLGVAKQFNEVMKIDVTAYYTILNNALVRRNFQLNGQDSILYDGVNSQVQAMQNAAEATVYGIQAGVELNLGYGFNFGSNLNVQHGEEELDDGSTSPSRHAAPVFGQSRVSYKNNDLMMQLYAVYQGEKSYDDLPESEQGKDEIYAKDKDGNNYAPRWYTLNFKAMYQLSDMLSISAGLENMTDQRYRPYSSGISAPGRNAIISVMAKF